MKKIVDFNIVEGSAWSVNKIARDLTAVGWEPYGKLFAFDRLSGITYAQAFVMREQENQAGIALRGAQA